MRRLIASWRVVLAGAVALAVVAWIVWSILPWAPTREQAEQDIVAVTAQDGVPGVRAVCEDPDPDGWRCLLRNAAGGYGRADGRVRSAPESQAQGPLAEENVYWSYEFPVDSRGVLSREVDRHGRYSVTDVVRIEARRALGAVGRGDALPVVDCTPGGPRPGGPRNDGREVLEALEGPPIGTIVACTSGGGVDHVRVERLTETGYRVALTADGLG